MRTLVIDCATEACSVALFDDGVLLAGDYRVLGRGHAEQLVPMIAALPERGRANRIAVALGPGSFTGVRVGLAAARALALAWHAELVGYPTLALVAAMARAASGTAQTVGVAMSGGHGEWFVQSFGDAGIVAVPVSLAPREAAEALADELIVGSQAEALVALRGSGRAIAMLPDAREFPHLPCGAITTMITPLYGRAPDARLPGNT
jgi:tRNA threonylcarbamoyl adenosine modification protein YeaZ